MVEPPPTGLNCVRKLDYFTHAAAEQLIQPDPRQRVFHRRVGGVAVKIAVKCRINNYSHHMVAITY